MSDKDLLKWLKRQFLDIHVGDETPQPLCRVDLLHTVDGDGIEKLETMRVSDDTDPENLAGELYAAAEHDAQTRSSGNVQRYVVLAFRETSERAEHDSSFAFICRVNSSKLLMGGDTEPPTDKGVTAHYMRHDENMHRIMMQTQEALMGRVATELARETARREKAEERNDKLKEREEELLDRKFEREMMRAQALQSQKFFAELAGLVTTVAPLVMGRLLAGKEGAMAPSARDVSVQKFLKSLSQTEVQGIIASLKTPNQIALMELYNSYAESEKVSEAKKERILQDGGEEEALKEVEKEAR